MHNSKNNNKKRATIGTILFHALVLILLLFIGLSAPYPPPPEAGVIIDIGFSKTGLGDTKTEITEKETIKQTMQSKESIEKITKEPTITENVITQEQETAPVIKKDFKEIEKENKKRLEEIERKRIEKQKKQEEVFKKKLAEAWKKAKQLENNDGQTGQSGNQGDPEGKPSNNYTPGLGAGDIGYNLAGRSMITKPAINDDSQEIGKVTVSIKVDRHGNVVYAKYTLKGSTTSNPHLVFLAEKAAYKAGFNSDVTAPEEQWGSITFIFKVK